MIFFSNIEQEVLLEKLKTFQLYATIALTNTIIT